MISAELRRTIRTLYAFACGYCGVTEIEVGAYLTIDHYQPREAGGSDEIDNLVYACHACNLYKSAAWNLDEPPILHPLRTEMAVHIRALPDGTLEGLTPEGIRHIACLHLNRLPMVQRRNRIRLLEAVWEREAETRERDRQATQAIKDKKRLIHRKERQNRKR